MNRVFVDADIIMDLLTRREGYFEFAAELFTLGDDKKIEIYISSLTVANVFYLLNRQYNNQKAWQIIRHFRALVYVLPVDSKVIDLALSSQFKDFENAIQYFTALEDNIGTLLTRNLRDFADATIVVMTPESFLKMN